MLSSKSNKWNRWNQCGKISFNKSHFSKQMAPYRRLIRLIKLLRLIWMSCRGRRTTTYSLQMTRACPHPCQLGCHNCHSFQRPSRTIPSTCCRKNVQWIRRCTSMSLRLLSLDWISFWRASRWSCHPCPWTQTKMTYNNYKRMPRMRDLRRIPMRASPSTCSLVTATSSAHDRGIDRRRKLSLRLVQLRSGTKRAKQRSNERR